MRRGLILLAAWLLVLASIAWSARGADASHCAVCGNALGYTIYKATDKVTRETAFLCPDCVRCPEECYICGLPVRANFLTLADGRFLCARDTRTAVLDETKARTICTEVCDELNRMLSRFWTLPTTNVTVELVDRVNLYDEFSVRGNDFECPDVLGYIHSRTNSTGLNHSVNLMSALPRAEFQATCAHEFTHAWVFENVSAARRKSLSRDAHEGFCELVAYLLMDSLHEEEQKKLMLRNTYTRGQIDLFIEAEKTYGFNDILDWIRWGVNSRLKAGNLVDVRNVEMPRAISGVASNWFVLAERPAPAPERLLLKGISSSGSRPLALINNQSLAAGESVKVRVGTSNVVVQCLTVGARSARIRLVDSGRELELFLPEEK